MGVLAKYGGLAYDTFNNTMYMADGTGTTGAATLSGSTGLRWTDG
jgi:hypothetical protein